MSGQVRQRPGAGRSEGVCVLGVGEVSKDTRRKQGETTDRDMLKRR